MKKNLVIITNAYPYGKGEEFFEEEIRHLANVFEKIFVVSRHTNKIQTRELPPNATLFRPNIKTRFWDILFAWKYFFDNRFWDEIKNIRTNYKLKISFKIIIELVHALYYGDALEQYLRKIITKHKLNTSKLYLYSYWSFFGAYAIAKYKSNSPHIVSFTRAHASDIYCNRRTSHYLPLRSFLLKQLDCFFFISEHGIEYFKDKLKCYNSKKLFVSRLGVSNNYSPTEVSRSNQLKIVTCSGVLAIKRIDLIVKALAQIESFNVSWIHIGDGELMQPLKMLAEKLLHNKTNIKYEFKGQITNNKVFDFYKNQQIDVFLNVSVDEGIPVSMMEACSFGIPIIATNVGGVSEIVNDENGILLSPNPSENEIVNALTSIRNMDDIERNKKRFNAYNTWNSRYNANVNYPEFIKQLLHN